MNTMTRKEQLKKMTIPELEAQKQFILNGRVSFEDQIYSAELDDEIRLRKSQEQEPDKHDESGQRIEKKASNPDLMENGAPLSCENLYYRLKSLEEKHNAMYVSHTQNLEVLNTHVRAFKVTIDNAKKAINSFNSLNGRIDVISETHNDRFNALKNDFRYTDERLIRQAEALDVVFENYNSQNEKMLKLEAAIKDLKHYESVLVESGRFEQYAKYVEDFNKFLEMKEPRSESKKQDNRKEAAKKAITENHRLSRILERTEDIEESICGLKRYMKEKDRALKFLIFVDVAITASLMAVMYKYILFM